MAAAANEEPYASAADTAEMQGELASLDEDGMALVNHYAAVIQKHWRGYQARRSLHDMHLAPSSSQQGPAAAEAVQELQTPAPAPADMQHGMFPDVWKPSTATVVRNRGVLQTAVAQRNQHEQHKLESWKQFAVRQFQRYVAAPAKPGRRVLPESTCYRLRVQSVSNLPPLSQVTAGVSYELQLGVSLFDESLGVFYGNTCYSPCDTPKQQQQNTVTGDGTAAGVGVEFCFDIFFHSAISDPRCMAVVEVIMVGKDSTGMPAGQFSVGWAQLPLFALSGSAGQLLGSQPASAPIMSGTPRYLLFRSVCGEALPPPTVIQGCHLTYQAEAYPAMNPVRPLLPPDFLVTYTDVVPGLRRFDCNGQFSTGHKSVISALASPMLGPIYTIHLDKLQLRLPQVLHNLLSVLPQLAGVLPPPDLPSLLAVPSQATAVRYTLLAGVHNGRTFVGPQLTIQQLQVQPTVGSVVLKPQEGLQGLQLEGLVADELVVLVFELLAEAAAEQGQDASLGPVLVGRAVMSPFAQISADGNMDVLSKGLRKLSFSCDSISIANSTAGCPLSLLGGMTRGLLPANWRALLGDTATRSIPDPEVQLELVAAGTTSQLPVAPVLQVAAASSVPAGAPPANEQEASIPSAAKQVVPAPLQQQTQPAVQKPLTPAKPDMLAPVAYGRRASASVIAAAKLLEEAANIPVEERSDDEAVAGLIPAHRGSDAVPTAAAADHEDQQQLQQLTEVMQNQISALARAVEELKEERQTLRSSLTLLESSVTAHAQQSAPTAHINHQQQQQPNQQWQQPSQQPPPAPSSTEAAGWRPGSPSAYSMQDSPQPAASHIPAAELERLKALQPTTAAGAAGFGVPAGFSGAQAAAAQGSGANDSNRSGAPSRMVMQQLHEAGMGQALPTDVQALLRRSTAAVSGRPKLHDIRERLAVGDSSKLSPLVMDIEARDPRTASDVILQLLAFRPTSNPEATAQLPAALSSLYFTMQFYHFGPVVTEPCLLAEGSDSSAGTAGAASDGVDGPGQQQMHHAGLTAAGAAAAGPRQTYVLVPAKQVQRNGAGLVLKYQVDGSNPNQLLPGQDPAQAAFESHMAFCNYLAKHRLTLDVWDGDSLLQLGTAAVDLQGLLRQGQEFSELLVEAPLVQLSSNCSSQQGSQPAGQQQGQQSPEPLQLGHVVLRLINIGREPSNADARTPDFDAVQPGTRAAGKRVRVRAAPLEPSSPIAKELRSRTANSSPFKVDWQQQQQQQQQAADSVGSPDAHAAGVDPATAASDIISFEQRKVARARQLQQLLSNSPNKALPGSPSHNSFMQPTPQNSPVRRPGGAAEAQATNDPFRAVQWQLLADVDAVRKRQKAGFIRSQLRKDLVTPCTIQPTLGQTILLEHVLHNPLGRDAVFELKVSHPEELRALERVQEYRQLQLAAGPALSTPAAAARNHPPAPLAADGAPSLARLVQTTNLSAGSAQLVNKGRIFLAANEQVAIPFSFRSSSDVNSVTGAKEGGTQLQQQHSVSVAFTPLDSEHPVNILEVQVKPKPVIIDRTLRYHCPERDILRASLPLAALSSSTSQAVLAAAAAGNLTAAASRPDVTVDVSNTSAAAAAGAVSGGNSKQLGAVAIRFKCGLSPEVVQFYVWLYGDACMAKPLEVWQVFVHALQKVDMRAVVGQASSTSLAVAGGTGADRQVVCYGSNPAELQATPAVLKLPAGGISALNLTFRPNKAGRGWVRVHLVDLSMKQLIHAFLVATEASVPQISRRFEVELQAGTVTQRQIMYANPYSHQARNIQRFKFTTNVPWLLSFQPAVLELAPKGSKPVVLVIDGRGLKPAVAVQALVFVHDDQDREEECMEVLVKTL